MTTAVTSRLSHHEQSPDHHSQSLGRRHPRRTLHIHRPRTAVIQLPTRVIFAGTQFAPINHKGKIIDQVLLRAQKSPTCH